jgi:glycosyltransferase involved in cell wall biosynthesis
MNAFIEPDPAQLIFLRFEGNVRSRTTTFLPVNSGGLPRVKVVEVPPLKTLRKSFQTVKQLPRSATLLVASPNSLIVVILFILRKQRPILDAGWPLIDGVISSRRQFGFLGMRVVSTYLIDLIAFHFSKLIFLESVEQVTYVRRSFLVNKRKLRLLFTGFNESRVVKDLSTKIHSSGPRVATSVLFRGGNQDEAGLVILDQALRALPKNHDFRFIIISRGFSSTLANNEYLRVIDKELSDLDLLREIEYCDVMLGQMSNHPRLKRTIPHKFFEAAFFGKPYVTSDFGLMEYFVKNKMVFGFTGGDPEALLRELSTAISSPDEMSKRAARLHSWYADNASQKMLAKQFKDAIKET